MQKTARKRERSRARSRARKNAKLLHQISQMRRNTQKLLKGRASQSTQRKTSGSRLCLYAQASGGDKSPPVPSRTRKWLFIETKRYKWNHYARWLHTRSVKSKCDALMKKTTNRSIGRTSLRKEQEALWE